MAGSGRRRGHQHSGSEMSVGTVKSALSVRSTCMLGMEAAVAAAPQGYYYYPEGRGEEVQVRVHPGRSLSCACACACRGRGAPSMARWGFPGAGLVQTQGQGQGQVYGAEAETGVPDPTGGFSNLDFTDLRDPFASSPPRRRSAASMSASAGSDSGMVDGIPRVQRSRTRMSAWGRLPLLQVQVGSQHQQQQQQQQQQLVPGGVGLKKSLRRKGRVRSGETVVVKGGEGAGVGEGMMTIQDSAMLAERLLVQLGAERAGGV